MTTQSFIAWKVAVTTASVPAIALWHEGFIRVAKTASMSPTSDGDVQSESRARISERKARSRDIRELAVSERSFGQARTLLESVASGNSYVVGFGDGCS